MKRKRRKIVFFSMNRVNMWIGMRKKEVDLSIMKNTLATTLLITLGLINFPYDRTPAQR